MLDFVRSVWLTMVLPEFSYWKEWSKDRRHTWILYLEGSWPYLCMFLQSTFCLCESSDDCMIEARAIAGYHSDVTWIGFVAWSVVVFCAFFAHCAEHAWILMPNKFCLRNAVYVFLKQPFPNPFAGSIPNTSLSDKMLQQLEIETSDYITVESIVPPASQTPAITAAVRNFFFSLKF